MILFFVAWRLLDTKLDLLISDLGSWWNFRSKFIRRFEIAEFTAKIWRDRTKSKIIIFKKFILDILVKAQVKSVSKAEKLPLYICDYSDIFPWELILKHRYEKMIDRSNYFYKASSSVSFWVEYEYQSILYKWRSILWKIR